MAAVVSLAGAASAAPSSAITYGYDELGRLVAVSDPANGAAKYAYDAAGNVTSITRQTVSVVSVASFGPKIGTAGTVVTIYGTGFSATAGQDTVKFNGTTAAVTSASATQLVATVPSGATTGTISVTAPGGSATSSGSFTIGSGPAITALSASVGSVGGSLTISGTGFDTTAANDVVLLGGLRAPVTTASATSLTLTIPASSSGKVTVVTPNGKAVSSADLVVPPAPYGASDIDTNVHMAVGDSRVIFTAANKVSVALIDTVGGQNLSINFNNVTASGGVCCNGVTYTLLSPSGAAIAGPVDFGYFGAFVEPIRIPRTGTYTLVIDPSASNSGNVTVSLYDTPADAAGTLTPGTPTTVSIGTPGQNARYTFDATQNDRVSMNVDNVSMNGFNFTCCNGIKLSLVQPDGSYLFRNLDVGYLGTFIDTTTLSQTGTYTVVVDPFTETTGSLRLSLYNVPPDVSGTTTIGGPPVDTTISTPGQNANYTFPGTTGKNIHLQASNINYPFPGVSAVNGITLAIYDSNNNVVLPPTEFGYLGTTLSATLPADDTYRIALNPLRENTGSLTLTLTDPPGPPIRQAKQIKPVAAPTSFPLFRVGEARTQADATPGPEEWTPDAKNQTGDWRSHRGRSPWEHYAPLQAPNEVTALAGQALTLNGQPLENVTVEIEDSPVTAKTDKTGRFLLAPAPAGHQVLIVDGTSAGTNGKPFGTVEIGVDLLKGRTTRLSDTIWMTRIDKGHEVTIDSPTSKETVITTPHIPGLELHLQPGTTIKDGDGNAVTRVSITPVPVDRPPFALPIGVTVPLYFTIQPGGAYLSKPAQLIYPNYTHLPPGQRVPFWNYDPDKKGWYVYGRGTVTPDAKQVVPDDDTRIWAFTGAMISGLPVPPIRWPNFGKLFGDPVDPSSGLFAYTKTDLVEPGPAPIAITRNYRQGDSNSYSFGVGATMPYDLRLWSTDNYQSTELIFPDGARVHYQRISPGNGLNDAAYEAKTTPTPFLHSTIVWNDNIRAWNLTRTDGSVYTFGENAPLQSIRDRFGNIISLTRTQGQLGDITKITSSSGRWIKLTYDTSHRVTQAQDSAGRTVGYSYYTGTGTGELQTVTDAKGGATTYTYDASHQMKTIKDPRNVVYMSIGYYADGRVQTQTQADTPATTFQFAYSTNGNGDPQTDITDPRGNVQRVIFNADGFAKSEIDAVGKPEQQTTSFEREPGTDLLIATVDPLNRRTELGHDSRGNLTSVTRLAGTGNSVTTSFTYDPKFSQLKTVTDPLNHTTTYDYNTSGALTGITDPLTHQTTFVPDAAGLPTQVKDALNNQTTYGYLAGDLVSVSDPLGNTTTRFVDNAGRVAGLTDPTGNRTSYLYDNLNAVTKITDAKAGQTLFGYDANDNLTTVTDPDGTSHVTTYTYDNLDRVATRKDALLHQETYAYDGNSNLTRFTDRKGQVTSYKYDALNRRTFVGFGTAGTPPNETYNSRIDHTYDAGNRLLTAVDSANGTITEVPDNLDRLTSETTPQGTVSYTYDNADRRLTMTAAGQAQVVYGYDNADRLLSVTQGTSAVGIGYDDADRRTNVTLPNAIIEQYGYDNASELTGITYKLGASTLGDLNYGYDFGGKRTAVWGTYARTGLPTAVTSATTYNAANQLTKWANKATTIDLNGSLTSDSLGTTYTWNNRGQLTSTAKTGTAVSYAYDAFGRRKSETVNSTTTSFLYDGANVVQEQSAATANLLTGLGIDETFARTIGSDQKSFLGDALGSTVALADTAGAVTTSYTYDPFGKGTVTGAASTNTFQYTGREADANGLTELRARYYSPTLQRFLSEDPIGYAGGEANIYSYGSNSPTNLVDPLGLCSSALSIGGLLRSAIGRCGALNAIMFWSTFAPWGPELRLLEEGVLELRAVEEGAVVLRGGDSAAAAYGRAVHSAHDYGPGFVKEFRGLPSGARPDAVNLTTREVVELKPDRAAAIKLGQGQLRRYADELNKEFPGPPFTTRLVTYPRFHP
ncbi:MAG: IPT/TIG domain-containing protein [Actinobacteria bacterium]|nr:IPT/TIG domain-containing protein [Actinomycetota bacterium]